MPALIRKMFMLTNLFSILGVYVNGNAQFNYPSESDKITIKEMSEMIVAETIINSSYENARSIGFRRLLSYISGNNSQEIKIAMASPVIMEQVHVSMENTETVFKAPGNAQWKMTFVMPNGFNLESLPKADDQKVKIQKIPAAKRAVIRFSGQMSKTKFTEKYAKLEEWLSTNKMTSFSAPRSAGYNPPWTLPEFRRNEIWIDVK